MNIADYQAGQYEAQHEYQGFLPSTILHPRLVADAKLHTLLGQADRV